MNKLVPVGVAEVHRMLDCKLEGPVGRHVGHARMIGVDFDMPAMLADMFGQLLFVGRPMTLCMVYNWAPYGKRLD